MASKKNLKKDIDYLITDIIFDCYDCMEDHPERDFSAYEQIINDIIFTKKSLLERINHFDSTIHGKSNHYFRTIKNDLVASITQAYDQLTKLGC